MFPPALLELVQKTENVSIVSDNHIRPFESFTEKAPLVRVSRCPSTKSCWSRRRRNKSKRSSPALDGSRSRWESSPRQMSLASAPARRISIAVVPDNVSNENLSGPSSPRGKISAFNNPESFQSPRTSTKITSPSLVLTPGGDSSTGASSSSSGSSSLLFNRWDSSPSSKVVFSPPRAPSPKGKYAASSTMMSLKDYAAQRATGLSVARRACFSIDKTFHEKLRSDTTAVMLSPPKKPKRRGSYDNVSETASLLDEALRITSEGEYDEDPFVDNSTPTATSSIPAPPLSC